jgi:hypothetical protein
MQETGGYSRPYMLTAIVVFFAMGLKRKRVNVRAVKVDSDKPASTVIDDTHIKKVQHLKQTILSTKY